MQDESTMRVGAGIRAGIADISDAQVSLHCYVTVTLQMLKFLCHRLYRSILSSLIMLQIMEVKEQAERQVAQLHSRIQQLQSQNNRLTEEVASLQQIALKGAASGVRPECPGLANNIFSQMLLVQVQCCFSTLFEPHTNNKT